MKKTPVFLFFFLYMLQRTFAGRHFCGLHCCNVAHKLRLCSALIKEQYHFLGCIALERVCNKSLQIFSGCALSLLQSAADFLPLFFSCCLQPVCNILIKRPGAFLKCALVNHELQPPTAHAPSKNALALKTPPS